MGTFAERGHRWIGCRPNKRRNATRWRWFVFSSAARTSSFLSRSAPWLESTAALLLPLCNAAWLSLPVLSRRAAVTVRSYVSSLVVVHRCMAAATSCLALRGVASCPCVVAGASCCQLPKIGDGCMGFNVGLGFNK